MNRSPMESCRDSPSNAYWNNATNPPDQSVENAALLNAFLTYSIAGGIASVLNIVCILIFITKKDFREKYLFFTVLAFANLINTFFMFIAGLLRRQMIFANQFMQMRSIFECLLLPFPHFQLAGGQLPALVLLVIDIERFVAVYSPLYYKAHITNRTRGFVAIGCFVVVLISQLFGYLISYLNRDLCVNAFCSLTSVFGMSYGNYNFAIVIMFPVCALILNISTYIGAKRLGERANMKRELKLIFTTLIITLVDVLLIACPNIFIFFTTNQIIKISSTISLANLSILYIFFCCNSAINLFVYIFLKRDFRNHLLLCISLGALRPQLNVTDVMPRAPTLRSRQVAPTIETEDY